MTIVNGYTTLAKITRKLGINNANSDEDMEDSIMEASRQIDDYTGRRYWQDSTVQTREFYADDYRELISSPDQVLDISTTTGLIVKIDTNDDGQFATTLTLGTHYVLLRPNAADDSEPYTGIRMVDSVYNFPRYTSGRPGVQVTAKFGWASVPTPVQKACLIQSVLLFKATDAAMGGLSFGDGSFMRIREGLNPIAASLVERYAFARVG